MILEKQAVAEVLREAIPGHARLSLQDKLFWVGDESWAVDVLHACKRQLYKDGIDYISDVFDCDDAARKVASAAAEQRALDVLASHELGFQAEPGGACVGQVRYHSQAGNQHRANWAVVTAGRAMKVLWMDLRHTEAFTRFWNPFSVKVTGGVFELTDDEWMSLERLWT